MVVVFSEQSQNDIFVPRIVAAELDSQSDGPRAEHHFTKKMADIGKFQLIAMNQREYALFGNFVSGNAFAWRWRSCDDSYQYPADVIFPIIDERKGTIAGTGTSMWQSSRLVSRSLPSSTSRGGSWHE